jgi:hypothetical protein
MRVEPGQVRRWYDGSGAPFLILEVDRSKKFWNCKFLGADGKVEEYHEHEFADRSVVVSEAPVQAI